MYVAVIQANNEPIPVTFFGIQSEALAHLQTGEWMAIDLPHDIPKSTAIFVLADTPKAFEAELAKFAEANNADITQTERSPGYNEARLRAESDNN